jgi:hypothetical protein
MLANRAKILIAYKRAYLAKTSLSTVHYLIHACYKRTTNDEYIKTGASFHGIDSYGGDAEQRREQRTA